MEMTYPKVLPGGLSSADPETGATIAAEAPEPPVKLNAKEKKLWLHVTAALEQYGLVHRTDGMMLTIICKTFCDWAAQEEFLQKLARDNNGSYYVKTPNGYEQPHQAYYVARDKKRELLKWLPEAALTIPSFHKLKAEQITPQGDLFDDPVEQFRQRKAKIGLRAIPGGKPNGGED